MDDVLEVHAMILPSAPVRDEGALISAVNKPWASYEGIESGKSEHAFVAAWITAHMEPLH